VEKGFVEVSLMEILLVWKNCLSPVHLGLNYSYSLLCISRVQFFEVLGTVV
jgi:hypothetical protein